MTLDFLNIHGVVIGYFASSDIPAERTSSYGNIEDWDMSGVVALNCLFTSECPDENKRLIEAEDKCISNGVCEHEITSNLGLRYPGEPVATCIKACTEQGRWSKNATAVESFNADISKWDTSVVYQFGLTFHHAKSFNVDISSWDFSRSTNFVWMLFGATSFNQDVSKWNINPAIVDTTVWMFRETANFNQLWCSPTTWARTPLVKNDFLPNSKAQHFCCGRGKKFMNDSYTYPIELKHTIHCLDCSKGSYQSRVFHLNATCPICPRNTFTAALGLPICADCSGRFFSASNASSCQTCSPGTYKLDANGSVSCHKCIPGKYQSLTGQTSCHDCPLGYHQPDEKASICFPCIPGTHEHQNGSTACQTCLPGRHQMLAGKPLCVDCPTGQYMNEKGAVNCLACNPGTFENETGSVECKPCRSGQHRKSSDNAMACHDCPVGKASSRTGTISCIPCSPGKISNKEGNDECDKCPLGYLQPEPKQSECAPVAAGSIVAKGGSSSVVVPLGSKIKASAPSGFEACEAGTIGNTPPNESCPQCAAGTSSTPGATTCQACDKGKFNDKMGGTCRDCVQETFQDQNTNPSISCISCPAGWQQHVIGSSTCLSLNWKTAESCKDTEYLNDTARDVSLWECQPCPIGGDCNGPIVWKSIGPLPGWWEIPIHERTVPVTEKDLFAECLYPLACLGRTSPLPNNNMGPNTSCANQLGFKNNSRLCQACASGFSRTSKSSCISCTNEDGSGKSFVLVLAVLATFLMFVGMITMRMRAFRTFDAQRRRKSLHSTIKKILLSHIQTLGIVLSLSVPWPAILGNVLNSAASIASFSEGVNHFECLNKDMDHADFYNGVLVFAAVGPLVFVGFIALYWFVLIHWCGVFKCGSQIRRGALCPKNTSTGSTLAIINTKRNSTGRRKMTYSDADAFVSTSVLLWFIILPSLLQIGSSSLKCYGVGDKSYVFIDLEKECFQDDHLVYSLLVAGPMIFLYGAVLPGYFLLRLQRVGESRLTKPSLVLRWGMLHSGYRKEKFWWEGIVLLRKYVIIVLVTFDNRGEFQLHMATAVLIVALHLHDSNYPFGHRRSNSMNSILHRYEMASLVILLFMVWSGVFFSLRLCPNWECDFFSVIILGANFAVVCILMVMFLKEFWKRNNCPKKISKCLGRSGSGGGNSIGGNSGASSLGDDSLGGNGVEMVENPMEEQKSVKIEIEINGADQQNDKKKKREKKLKDIRSKLSSNVQRNAGPIRRNKKADTGKEVEEVEENVNIQVSALPPTNTIRVAAFEYVAAESGELDMKVGDKIELLGAINDGDDWGKGKNLRTGDVGDYPVSYLTTTAPPPFLPPPPGIVPGPPPFLPLPPPPGIVPGPPPFLPPPGVDNR